MGLSFKKHAWLNLDGIAAASIVVLGGLHPSGVDHYMEVAVMTGALSIDIPSNDLDRIVRLFCSLPEGEQARCHIPPFGYRFFAGKQLVLEASVCWECNNIYGRRDGKPLHFAFDAKASISRELLQLTQELARPRKKVGD